MIKAFLPALVASCLATAAFAVELPVSAVQMDRFRGVGLDQPIDGLIWRGGIAMVSQVDTFGGLSGLTFTGPDQTVAFVSDRGNFISGQLLYDDAGRLLSLAGASIEPMQNSKGAPLPRQYARDAEAITTILRNGRPVGVRVGFEHLTRLADYTLVDGVPGGAAREVTIPDWLTKTRTNESIEAVCIAPPRSPIAGSTLILTEHVMDQDGNHRAYLLGQAHKGELSYSGNPDADPSDCAFLPNGDLLVLERGVSFLSFVMTLRMVPADAVRAGNVMTGTVLLRAAGGDIDNMEQVAVHTAPNGETRIVLGSDNNFNDWERNLLLEFALPG